MKWSNPMNLKIKPIEELNILLVSNTDEVIENVKMAVKSIDKNLVSGCHLWRCEGAFATKAISIRKRYETDIVLVCLYDGDTSTSLQELGVLLGAFSETPIITLTRSADHILALAAIEEGAASNVTDEDLQNDPRRLKNAMEYSLARYKNARTGKLYLREALQYLRKQNKENLRKEKKHSAKDLRAEQAVSSKALTAEKKRSSKTLKQEKKHSAEDLRIEKEKSSSALEQEMERSAQAVRTEQERSEVAMHEVKEKNASDAKEKEDVIRWLSGGYSVEKIPLSKSTV